MDTSLIPAATAVLGIIIGATLTAAYTRWNERVKWQREHRVRYNNQRIDVYASFLNDGGHIGRGELKDGDAPRMQRFLLTHNKIRMLSSESVRESAKTYLAAVTVFFRRYTEDDFDLPDDAPSNLFNAEDTFTEATREELGAR